MNVYYRFRDGFDAYPTLVEQVLAKGITRQSRGRPTLDKGYTLIELDSPFNALPLGQGRRLSRQIAALEALQLIGAEGRPDLLMKYAPQFAVYSDDEYGGSFHGNYGDRIGCQMVDVTRKLSADKGTRQAIATLWDPRLDNAEGHKDYPCTVALGFAITTDPETLEEVLEMYTTMRSNDVWLGLPYDLFQFTQLQITLAGVLGVHPGRYRHTAMSLHLYEDDVNNAITFLDRYHRSTITTVATIEEQPRGLHVAGHDNVMETARNLLDGTHDPLNQSQQWYHDTLHGKNE